MSEVLQGVLIAWTAVTMFSVLLSLFLYVRQRTREHLAFVILGTGSAAYAAAAARFYGATNAADAAYWTNLEFCFGAIAFVGLCLFTREILGRPTDRAMRYLLMAASIGVPVTLSGAVVDPGAPAHPLHTWIDLGSHRSAGVTAFFYLYTAVGVGALVYVVIEVVRGSKAHRSKRLLVFAASLYGVGWLTDALLRYFRIEAPFLTEHCTFVSALVVSYLLLDRFIHTASALESRTHELALRYDELRRVEEELVRKEQLAAVGELSAVIAHEVRNPLAVLRNAVSALRRDELSDEDRLTLLEVLDEESNRLNRLVRDLLVYARPVDPQSVSLKLVSVLERSVDLARRDHMRSAQIRVDFDVRADHTQIEGDPDLLERAFANVVENALQAMPDGGALTIRLDDATIEGDHPAVAIRFADTGEGMDTLVRARARDPFFTTRPSGTGLGLAIVERVVRAHGGRIDLKSGNDDGTEVTLVMPLEIQRTSSVSVAVSVDEEEL